MEAEFLKWFNKIVDVLKVNGSSQEELDNLLLTYSPKFDGNGINIIYVESINQEENTSFTSVFDNKYFVEIYTNGESDSNDTGDYKSAILNTKLMRKQ